MKFEQLPEPRLLFANGEHICPRRGISEYGVFDQTQNTRRREIYIGGVGTSRCVELLGAWIERCSTTIDPPDNTKHTNLKLKFCGVNKSSGFAAQFNFSSDSSRALRNLDIDDIVKIKNRTERVWTGD